MNTIILIVVSAIYMALSSAIIAPSPMPQDDFRLKLPPREEWKTDEAFVRDIALPFYRKHLCSNLPKEAQNDPVLKADLLSIREEIARHCACGWECSSVDVDVCEKGLRLYNTPIGSRDPGVKYIRIKVSDNVSDWNKRLSLCDEFLANPQAGDDPLWRLLFAELRSSFQDKRHDAKAYLEGAAVMNETDPRVAIRFLAFDRSCHIDGIAELFTNEVARTVLQGAREATKAFELRGEGWADTVTEEGWEGWAEHNAKAVQILRRAAELAPEMPEPHILLAGLAGRSCGGDVYKELNEALKRSLDSSRAFGVAVNFLMSRWGGSTHELRQLAKFGADSGAFDTTLPWSSLWLSIRLIQKFEIESRDDIEALRVALLDKTVDEALWKVVDTDPSPDALLAPTRAERYTLGLFAARIKEDWSKIRNLRERFAGVKPNTRFIARIFRISLANPFVHELHFLASDSPMAEEYLAVREMVASGNRDIAHKWVLSTLASPKTSGDALAALRPFEMELRKPDADGWTSLTPLLPPSIAAECAYVVSNNVAWAVRKSLSEEKDFNFKGFPSRCISVRNFPAMNDEYRFTVRIGIPGVDELSGSGNAGITFDYQYPPWIQGYPKIGISGGTNSRGEVNARLCVISRFGDMKSVVVPLDNAPVHDVRVILKNGRMLVEADGKTVFDRKEEEFLDKFSLESREEATRRFSVRPALECDPGIAVMNFAWRPHYSKSGPWVSPERKEATSLEGRAALAGRIAKAHEAEAERTRREKDEASRREALQVHAPSGHGHYRVTANAKGFTLDGHPFSIRAADINPARSPRLYWRYRLRVLKSIGFNAVAVSVCWNYHEWQKGQRDFKTDERDLREFVRIAQEEDLWVVLRVGPWVESGWANGGVPEWLPKGGAGRDAAIRGWFAALGAELKDMTAPKGGAIVAVESVRPGLFPVFDIPVLKVGAKDSPLADYEGIPIDQFGQKVRQWDVQKVCNDLEKLLEAGKSFVVLGAAGGTAYGFWSASDVPALCRVASPVPELGEDAIINNPTAKALFEFFKAHPAPTGRAIDVRAFFAGALTATCNDMKFDRLEVAQWPAQLGSAPGIEALRKAFISSGGGIDIVGMLQFAPPSPEERAKAPVGRFWRIRFKASSHGGFDFWKNAVGQGSEGEGYLRLTRSKWKTAVVWLNGHCLGVWRPDMPQKDMTAPGAWMKKGENEIVLFIPEGGFDWNKLHLPVYHTFGAELRK